MYIFVVGTVVLLPKQTFVLLQKNIFALSLSSRHSLYVFIQDSPIKVFVVPLSNMAELLEVS